MFDCEVGTVTSEKKRLDAAGTGKGLIGNYPFFGRALLEREKDPWDPWGPPGCKQAWESITRMVGER